MKEKQWIYLNVTLFFLIFAVNMSFSQSRANSATTKLAELSNNLNSNDFIEISRLLKEGADVNVRNDFGATALIMASQAGYIEIVKILLDASADVNSTSKDMTALFLASQQGYTEIVGLLLGAGADVNVKNEEGLTALYKASQKGHLEIVKLLLSVDANTNYSPSIHGSPQGNRL